VYILKPWSHLHCLIVLGIWLSHTGNKISVSNLLPHGVCLYSVNLDQPVSVERLAEMVHMGQTTFYQNFRSVMHVSPLQYAKSVRLHKAQVLILEGKNASEASHMVGYNNPAQFSREYERHFGYSPSATSVA
jgi:AraC-like DNA-binding protein